MTRTIKTTHELTVGDLVLSYGMRLLIDQPLIESTSHPIYDDERGTTLWTSALCVNAAALTDDRFITSRLVEHDGRWSIQGNGLARWSVEA